MADKNRNGIPDDREPKGGAYRSGQKVKGAFGDVQRRVPERGKTPGDPLAWLNNAIRTPIQQGVNFLGGFMGGNRDQVGTGAGDLLFGQVDNGYYDQRNREYQARTPQKASSSVMSPGAWQTQQPQAEEQAEMGLAEYLRMAQSLIGAGGGGVGMANYDPQRNTARSRASENDARLEAMYRQLRGSIDADAPVIQKGYQEAIDQTAQTSATAQQQTQAATDSANSRNAEVLANLGIQQAQGNIVQQGTDLNSQTARQIGDQATRGQAAGNRLTSNQATALTHNTNIGNAAGLEGNLQRASNNARLQAILAEIDMAEEGENASRQAQNASSSQNGLGQQLNLAQWLMGNDTEERRYQDDLSMQAAEMASQGQKSLPDLGAYLQALGIDPADIASDPGSYGSLLSAIQKFSVVQ